MAATSLPTLNKTMKSYQTHKQHKRSTPKHLTVRTTLEVPTWNDQKYEITVGLTQVFHGHNISLRICSDSDYLVTCSALVMNS